MIQWLIALAAVVPALAQTDYLVPYADGSDGWNDAYQQARGAQDQAAGPDFRQANADL